MYDQSMKKRIEMHIEEETTSDGVFESLESFDCDHLTQNYLLRSVSGALFPMSSLYYYYLNTSWAVRCLSIIIYLLIY